MKLDRIVKLLRDRHTSLEGYYSCNADPMVGMILASSLNASRDLLREVDEILAEPDPPTRNVVVELTEQVEGSLHCRLNGCGTSLYLASVLQKSWLAQYPQSAEGES